MLLVIRSCWRSITKTSSTAFIRCSKAIFVWHRKMNGLLRTCRCWRTSLPKAFECLWNWTRWASEPQLKNTELSLAFSRFRIPFLKCPNTSRMRNSTTISVSTSISEDICQARKQSACLLEWKNDGCSRWKEHLSCWVPVGRNKRRMRLFQIIDSPFIVSCQKKIDWLWTFEQVDHSVKRGMKSLCGQVTALVYHDLGEIHSSCSL